MKHVSITFGLILLLILGFASCIKNDSYSFFVAGHVYGSSGSDSIGVYPAFKETFDDLNAEPLMQYGFLTGDIVKHSTQESWAAVDSDLDKLNVPVEFAPGNHDLQDYDFYVDRYGAIGRYFFLHDDLFLIPEVQMDGWVINKHQLDFFAELVAANQERINRVFVFVHQVVFMDYMYVTPNSTEGKSEALNFESEVLPVLEKTNLPTYFFAGDVGAFDWGMPLFHERRKNVTYVASGMGGGVADNYLIVEVFDEETINFRIVSLNGDDLGEIGDY